MKKYFTEKQINLSTFIGGPLAGGLMLYRSFRKLKKKEEARIVISTMVLLTTIFWVLMFNVENEIIGKLSGIIVTGIFVGLSSFTYRKFLKNRINEEFEEGAKKASSWFILPYSLGGILISIAILFLIGMNQAPFKGDVTTYGVTNNEIYYDKGNIGLESLNKIAGVLRRYGYFGDDQQNSVRAEKVDNLMKVTVLINESFVDKPEIIEALKEMKSSMQVTLSMPSQIIVEYYDLGGNVHHKVY
ncbi:MAG: hypothetical protein C0595_13910 [Marinilabiliales bacterium]|nr:MAG: hypothetical protein C0595_13910 [Marinilabiliales bacterium]